MLQAVAVEMPESMGRTDAVKGAKRDQLRGAARTDKSNKWFGFAKPFGSRVSQFGPVLFPLYLLWPEGQ